jgi:hypothetical protein
VALVGGVRGGDRGGRLFNLLALLLAAHGVTVGIAHMRRPAVRDRAESAPAAAAAPSALPLFRWLVAAGTAAAMLSPLLVTGFTQRRQVSWLDRPGPGAVSHLVASFAGSQALTALVALLVMVG